MLYQKYGYSNLHAYIWFNMTWKPCNIKYELSLDLHGSHLILYIWIYMAFVPYIIEYTWCARCPLLQYLHEQTCNIKYVNGHIWYYMACTPCNIEYGHIWVSHIQYYMATSYIQFYMVCKPYNIKYDLCFKILGDIFDFTWLTQSYIRREVPIIECADIRS